MPKADIVSSRSKWRGVENSGVITFTYYSLAADDGRR
jgi:hypothetical protein